MNDNARVPFRSVLDSTYLASNATDLPRTAPSWSLAQRKRDWLGIFLIVFCALIIAGTSIGIYLANMPDEYDRIRQACPGKSVDVWSRDGGTLLAIRCELPEPRS